MGLDMYLYGVHEYGHEIDLQEEIYWRKANQIHKWFVDNVQYGIDNCAMYCVSKTDLKLLSKTCLTVLNDPSVEEAIEILPPKDGCFFGSTDITNDENFKRYLYDLLYTVEQIEKLLDKDYDYYYYQSSW